MPPIRSASAGCASAAASASALFGKSANRAFRSGFNPRFFAAPPAAGRRITAGFSWMQRIGKSAAIDVWFPQKLKDELNALMADGAALGDKHFPAEWAAVRQFELLQDAGNYKIYNMQADYLARSLYELTKNMRGGGYRVTIATVGGYDGGADRDELEILDRRLQERLSQTIHMLYLEDQSAEINLGHDEALATGAWDYRTALPHVGMTLGARDLFRPVGGGVRESAAVFVVPPAPHRIEVADWVANLGVCDSATGDDLRYAAGIPKPNGYSFRNGTYAFARADEGRSVNIRYMKRPSAHDNGKPQSISEKKHRLAQRFFDLLGKLPSKHIVHDTAVGLQLPDMINEEEWLYIPASDESFQAFNMLLRDVFRPLDVMSLSALDGRADAQREIKATVQHMGGYGDRLTSAAARFQRDATQFLSASL